MSNRTARILVCDRCKAETEQATAETNDSGFVHVRIETTRRPALRRRRLDLCRDCAITFDAWLKGDPDPVGAKP